MNLDGKRFVDEGEQWYRPIQAVSRQKRSTVVLVCDKPAWDAWTGMSADGAYFTIGDQIEKVLCGDKVGGKVYTADTLEDLADQLEASGIATHMMNKGAFLKTMAEYNAAVEAGEGASLDVPRKLGSQHAITEPPFYAFPCRPAIYATWGGVAINTRAQVLDINREVIPGLYAAFPTAGGVMREIYTGAVGMAGVTGWWAGKAVAEDLANL